jgi:hypothetical protein
MGKASSSKKVAKAARTGGNLRAARDRKWGFPLAMAGILVVGLGLIVLARQEVADEKATPPRIGDHWHSAYAIYQCDTFGPPVNDIGEDVLGIHTHTDGLMHIHPFSSNASGANAQLGVFADQVGIEFGDESFTLPTGETFTTGDECGDGEGVVRVIKWSSGDFEGEPEIITSDFGDIRFTGDGEAYTIFFGPESALDDPSKLLPPSLATINEGATSDGGEAPNVSIPEDLLAPPTTAPAEGSTTSAPEGATTTAPADGATTTAPPG